MEKWRAYGLCLIVAIMAMIVAQRPQQSKDEQTGLKDDTARRGILARQRGWSPEHPVLIIPGVTTGLEQWEGLPCAAMHLRQRVWGSYPSLQALLRNPRCWVQHMQLNYTTGLDPDGIRLRASEGLSAVGQPVYGHRVWAPQLQALADMGYDQTTLVAAPYDFRPAVANMEYRDHYFTRLKAQVEELHDIKGTKVLIAAHSWGETVARNFLFWVERQEPGWTEKHVAVLLNIAGYPLGVPKTRDTAELGRLALYLSKSYLPQHARAHMFRSWGSLIGMLPKGGNRVWGNATWAPDDTDALRQAGATYGAFITAVDVNDSSNSVDSMVKRGAVTPYSVNKAMGLLLQEASRTSPELHTQIGMWGASVGIDGERHGTGYDPKADVRFHDPMVDPMPNAPSLKMFNIYGVGKATERAYIHRHLTDKQAVMATKRGDQVSREVGDPLPWSIATEVSDASTLVRAGVRKGDGDGTVPLVSLGLLSYKGWRTPKLNPENFSVTTHELLHRAVPYFRGLRGNDKSGSHVGILGNLDLIDAVLALASGHYEEVPEKVISDIGKIANKIPF